MGVPQGTVLGPILFLVYVNDLPKCVQDAKIAMYADDTTVICHADNTLDLQERMNKHLNDIHNWIEKNRLIINVSKSNVLLIGSHQKVTKDSNFIVSIKNQKLPLCDSAKL